jgi:hypothetical protein
VQRGDVEGTFLFEAGDDRGVLGGRLIGADARSPAGDLALAVEHVLVRQRHAGKRALGRAFGDCRVDGLGPGERLILLQRDDAEGELMRRAQALNRGRGGLEARHLLVADCLGKRARGKLGKVGHGLAPATRTRRKSSTSAESGSSRATLPAVRDSRAACALAAARRSGGMSR